MTVNHENRETTPTPPPAADGVAFERVLGRYSKGREGPLLIATGGVHGNEPCGVYALGRVLAELEARSPTFRGTFIALAGNLPALRRGERYLDVDLNRIWGDPDVPAELRTVAHETSEARERRELLRAWEQPLDGCWEGILLLDLHATSADGAPFLIMSDTLQNRRVAFGLSIPAILGLEESVSGTLVEYFSERGHIALCVEGGRLAAGATIDHHESAVWLTLVGAGLLPAESAPDIEAHRARLKRASVDLPPIVEVLYRHSIRHVDAFAMEPNLANFQRVQRHQLLARDGECEIRAPFSALILMPRYQSKGADGFFLVRPVRKFWLRLSALARRLPIAGLLPRLPGVSPHPRREGMLLVNPRIARQAVQVFHLLGYRRCRGEGDFLVFSRRREGRF